MKGLKVQLNSKGVKYINSLESAIENNIQVNESQVFNAIVENGNIIVKMFNIIEVLYKDEVVIMS